MANPSLQIGNSNWAIKKDNLLGYSTAGTRFLPIPITMTRASAGTRVNSSGLVETVELLGSEEITNGDFATDSDWSKETGWSIADNKAIVTNAPNLYQRLTQSSLSFTLNLIYKISVTCSEYSAGFIYLRKPRGVESDTNLRIDSIGTFVFYVQALTDLDAFALAIGAVGTDLKIDNVSVKESTRNDLARVDYTGSTSSLLAEPQRTNLVTYSEDFSNAFWNLGNSSLASGFTSPDGTTNSYKLIEDTSTGSHSVYSDNVTVTVGSSYTYSLYVKKGERSNIRLDGGYRLSLDATFNLNTLVVTGNGTIETLSNGWYRLTATGVGEISTGATNVYTYLLDDSGTQSYTGNGNSGLYIWGGQLEAGSYATSYIPTSGEAGGVTRVQDQYSKTGISDKINSTEGTLFVEMAALANDGTYRYVLLSDGATANMIQIRYSDVSNNIQALVYSSSVLQAFTSYTPTDTTSFHKMAFKYKENDFALWVDGTEVGTATSGIPPINLSSLDFQSYFGKVKQLQVFKTALTDSELATLTTI